jgi:hypothetical protein
MTSEREPRRATSLGYDASAFHTSLCVNAEAAAIPAGLGLAGPPPELAAREDPPPGQGRAWVRGRV